ncbi:MAG: hypothetical protein HOV87_20070 [Catenulispora sp.]|nr:hypothetical protein [Catenulispora sp.]
MTNHTYRSDLEAVDRYWRAANYLSVGQIYLRDNPMLRRTLEPANIKPRLLGHWGTSPGENFVHAHLNRLINTYDVDLMTVLGPGHGGPAALACSWLDAGTEDDLVTEPDVVLACAGDVPTVEVLAAAKLLRDHLPGLRVPVVNVVDLMRLQPSSEHPHGLPDAEYDAIFTTDKPVIFPFHGYASLIHRLAYRRHGHANLHVRGYKEQGSTTTPFDMLVRNDLDRFQLVCDVIDRVPNLAPKAAAVRQEMTDARARHRVWIVEHGEDLPTIRDWQWTS